MIISYFLVFFFIFVKRKFCSVIHQRHQRSIERYLVVFFFPFCTIFSFSVAITIVVSRFNCYTTVLLLLVQILDNFFACLNFFFCVILIYTTITLFRVSWEIADKNILENPKFCFQGRPLRIVQVIESQLYIFNCVFDCWIYIWMEFWYLLLVNA